MGKNATLNYGRSISGSPAFWMKEPISKVSASLQLPLKVPVALETVSIWDARLHLRMLTSWSRTTIFITLFEQKKQHLWYIFCPILLVISNMKFYHKISEQFWRIWCFPYKVIGAALGCPRGVSMMILVFSQHWQICYRFILFAVPFFIFLREYNNFYNFV